MKNTPGDSPLRRVHTNTEITFRGGVVQQAEAGGNILIPLFRISRYNLAFISKKLLISVT